MIVTKVLEIENATVGQGGKPVLGNINMTLVEAEMCYLIGKSGAGKSTFLKTLYGVLPVLSGVVNVVGYDMSTIKRKEIPYFRRKLGMVFQEFYLFEKWSVGRNLDYILKATEWKDDHTRSQRVQEVLTDVNLLHKIDEPAYQLSGGEKQKLVIARSILNNPSLIIADEPTGNLDPDTSNEIMELLYRVATSHQTSILVATHDYLLMEKYPSRVYECKENTIKELT